MLPDKFAPLVKEPHYAAIFVRQHMAQKTDDSNEYEKVAEHMLALAKQMPGFLGFESASDNEGFGITISYWQTLDDIENWRQHEDHKAAQRRGKAHWYDAYTIRIAKVERAYQGPPGKTSS
ncbi:MAG: antibiotic biosynthesis monooxygenase family protein [bacterium]